MKHSKLTKLFLLVLVMILASSLIACNKTAKYDDLIIYTNSGGEGRAEWIEELALEEGFIIQVVFAGGGDITNRMIAEKNNPIADVVFGLNILNFEDFKSKDMLLQFVPVWADEVDSTMKDADGHYHGIVKQAILAIYNPDVYTEETAPKDWPDMWQNPEFEGKYNIFGLGGGTSRTILSGIAMRYLDANGELGISDQGWIEIEMYIKNGYFTAEGEDFVTNLIDQKVPISMIWGSGVIQKQDEHDFEFGIMNPAIGVPFVVEQVGISKDSKHIETAKEFVDWFGSSDVQTAWAQEFGTSPANMVAMEGATDEAKYLDSILDKSQEIDWAIVKEFVDLWVEKIELEFME